MGDFLLGLKDGQWAERVNVILNALRAQEACVPGLTDYLLTTARSHPSLVLRLFAMQHLSLWYGRETSADKRRENVTLLETLVADPGVKHDVRISALHTCVARGLCGFVWFGPAWRAGCERDKTGPGRMVAHTGC